MDEALAQFDCIFSRHRLMDSFHARRDLDRIENALLGKTFGRTKVETPIQMSSEVFENICTQIESALFRPTPIVAGETSILSETSVQKDEPVPTIECEPKEESKASSSKTLSNLFQFKNNTAEAFKSVAYAFRKSKGMTEIQLQSLWTDLIQSFLGYDESDISVREMDMQFISLNVGRNTSYTSHKTFSEISVSNNGEKQYSVEVMPYTTDRDIIQYAINAILKLNRQYVKILIIDKIYIILPDSEEVLDIHFIETNPLGASFLQYFYKGAYVPSKVKQFVEAEISINLMLRHAICN